MILGRVLGSIHSYFCNLDPLLQSGGSMGLTVISYGPTFPEDRGPYHKIFVIIVLKNRKIIIEMKEVGVDFTM